MRTARGVPRGGIDQRGAYRQLRRPDGQIPRHYLFTQQLEAVHFGLHQAAVTVATPLRCEECRC